MKLYAPVAVSDDAPPAAFRRLCVETRAFFMGGRMSDSSRLQAAVC